MDGQHVHQSYTLCLNRPIHLPDTHYSYAANDEITHTSHRKIVHTFSLQLMLMTFSYAILWMLMVAGFSGIIFYYVQARIVCNAFKLNSDTGLDNPDNCFHYVDKGRSYTRAIALDSTFLSTPADFTYTAICGGDGLKDLCNEVS